MILTYLHFITLFIGFIIAFSIGRKHLKQLKN